MSARDRTGIWTLLLVPLILAASISLVYKAREAEAGPFQSAIGVARLEGYSASSGSPILPSNIQPSASHPDVAYGITFTADTATTLWVRATYAGGSLDGTSRDKYLLAGAATVQSSMYTFTFGASRTYDNDQDGVADGTVSYNFVPGSSATVDLHVTEVRSDVR